MSEKGKPLMNKLNNKMWRSVLVLASLVLASVPANAATVTASASIFDVSTTLLSLGSNYEYWIDASTRSQSVLTTGSVLESHFLNDTAPNGDTSFAQVDNLLQPLPQTRASAVNNGFANATVLWSFDWTATADGQARIDVEYLFDTTLASLLEGENALASSLVRIETVLQDGTRLGTEALNFFNVAEGSEGGFDSLFLAFNVLRDQSGSFLITTASTAYAAPVPLPAGLPLLGSALLALAGLARRRLTKA